MANIIMPVSTEPARGAAVRCTDWLGRILIACECSGKVREAFRKKGWDAWSCDLKPAEDGSPNHIQGDCLEAMSHSQWDAFGMHPECRFLTVAGIHWNNRGRGWERTKSALQFVRDLIAAAGDLPWYLENPVSIIATHIRPASQYIQPYNFGEDASKNTGLWLNRLPLLKPTRFVPPRYVCCGISFSYELGKYGCPNCNGERAAKPRWANQTNSGQNKLTPSEQRSADRARTFAGIAEAMADQWTHAMRPNAELCGVAAKAKGTQ